MSFSISIAIISWMVGMIINAVLRKTAFYHNNLSNLNFIKSHKLNKIIGLDLFKWIVKNTFFKFFNQKLKLKKKVEKADITKLRAEMTISEIDHLIGFAFVSIFVFIKCYNSQYLFGFTIMIINILMNLYPSLLQQENKRRIDKMMKKLGLQ
ncbi:glycosyl-4,4'-diaponeurosporenoate acyltransferase CrtO family protein [Flavobacterium pedocola]